MGKINEVKDFTRGQLDAALMKIGRGVGMGTAEGIKALLSSKIQTAFYKSDVSTMQFITFGTLKNITEARSLLRSVEVKIEGGANKLLSKIEFEKTPCTHELVLVSGKRLQVDEWSTLKTIHTAGRSFGLSLCPAETAVQFWIQHPNLLPRGSTCRIAMKPIPLGEWPGSGTFELGYAKRRYIKHIDDSSCKIWDKAHWLFIRKHCSSN